MSKFDNMLVCRGIDEKECREYNEYFEGIKQHVCGHFNPHLKKSGCPGQPCGVFNKNNAIITSYQKATESKFCNCRPLSVIDIMRIKNKHE